MLLARGASPTEAEDILADLWADCVPGADERPSLLEKFSARCSLQNWLATVATNRWLDFKRRQARLIEVDSPQSGTEKLESLGTSILALREDSLIELLRDSLEAGFAHCSPSAMVLLRLVYLHGVTQREVVRMLGWSGSKVSRYLSQAMGQIEQDTLKEARKRDPWLELSWQDFMDLCETHQIGFL
jgi:RNA polymerase sigma factor (sigma-70 family)